MSSPSMSPLARLILIVTDPAVAWRSAHAAFRRRIECLRSWRPPLRSLALGRPGAGWLAAHFAATPQEWVISWPGVRVYIDRAVFRDRLVRLELLGVALFALSLGVYLVTRLVQLDQFPIYFFADEATMAV